MSEIDPRALRDAFGAFLTGVTVVTTVGEDGAPRGFTANSFASVSLDPPLLLVCPARRLSSFAAFEGCRDFAISVLAEGQEAVSNIFASSKGDRFAEVAWRPAASGAPVIEGAAAAFACTAQSVVPAGDHVILIGRVTAFERSGRRGLGYAGGRYFSLGLEREAAAGSERATIAGAIIERDGAVLLEQTERGMEPPSVALSAGVRTRDALAAALSEQGLSVDLGEAYSIFEDRSAGRRALYFRAEARGDASGPARRFTPFTDLASLRYGSDALHAMLTRYAAEAKSRSFNLYVGDEQGGDLHAL